MPEFHQARLLPRGDDIMIAYATGSVPAADVGARVGDATAVEVDDEADGADDVEAVAGFSPVRRPTTIPNAVVASAKRDVVDVVRPTAFVPMPAPMKATTMRIAMTRFVAFNSAVCARCGEATSVASS